MPCIMAQKSVSSGISRKSATSDTHRTTARGGVNTAAGSATEVKTTDPAWMNVVYRSLDLNDPANAVLYYPEEAADGQDNLFRLMLRLIAGTENAKKPKKKGWMAAKLEEAQKQQEAMLREQQRRNRRK